MDELANLKLPDLKKECKARGLSTGGNKADLVSRLQMAMSTEKPPSDDSVLDDALIDEDSMLGDDDDSVGDDSNDIGDLTTGSLDLSSPISKVPPMSISAARIGAAGGVGSPVKVSPMSPVKKVEAVKRPAPTSSPSKIQTNGSSSVDPESSSPVPKKKITINRESVQAPSVIETADISGSDQEEKKVVKIGTVPLTAEEKAKLRAQKFGGGGTASVAATKAAPAVEKEKPSTPITDEKMKKRADRFNNGSTSCVSTSENKVVSLTTEDDVKLAKRKERFGLVDESTKKDTRAARFGGGAVSSKAVAATTPSTDPTTSTTTDPGDKKSLRAARFGNTAT